MDDAVGSRAWVEHLDARLSLAPAPERGWPDPAVVVEVVVRSPVGETASYHLRVGPDRLSAALGPAEEAAVRFEVEPDTVDAVAAGRERAQRAFLGGRLQLVEGTEALLAVAPLLEGLGRAEPGGSVGVERTAGES